jgi:hypothetical protein
VPCCAAAAAATADEAAAALEKVWVLTTGAPPEDVGASVMTATTLVSTVPVLLLALSFEDAPLEPEP